jgi:hypothetical protein
MSVKIDGSKAKTHWFSNDSANGSLTKNQAVLYIPSYPSKLGQVTRDSAEGLTPRQVGEQRYPDKSTLDRDLVFEDFIIIDKVNGQDFDYDDGGRSLIHDLYVKKRIPFDALYPGHQLPGRNSEALIGYDRTQHLSVLLDVIKQYCGKGTYYDTKDPITWRWEQENEIVEIHGKLVQHKLCLYAAYTGRGKTKVSVEVATRLCQYGGVVLVTTPITDTKQSFKDNIKYFQLGAFSEMKTT